MKVMSVAAPLIAGLALVSALLGAAPFTPAILLFLIYTPFAALSAALGYTSQAVLIIAATVAAWSLSPIRFDLSVPTQLVWLEAWVVGWTLITAAFCVSKWRNAFWSALGRPTNRA